MIWLFGKKKKKQKIESENAAIENRNEREEKKSEPDSRKENKKVLEVEDAPVMTKKKKAARLAAGIGVMLVSLGILGVGVIYMAGGYLAGLINPSSIYTETPSEIGPHPELSSVASLSPNEIVYMNDVYNILLVGMDRRLMTGPANSDTIIILSIDKKHKSVKMTSVMRDSYVAIPGKKDNRINASFMWGGAQLLMDTIEVNFGVRVDKYIAVDFYTFADVVDAIGGVDINVKEAEVKYMNSYIQEQNRYRGRPEMENTLKKAGYLHLNGVQACGYARIRYVGNADFERTRRQRDVLNQVFKQGMKLNLIQISELLVQNLPKVNSNMSYNDLLGLASDVLSFGKTEIEQFRIPAEGTYKGLWVGGMNVLSVDTRENSRLLKQFIYE